MSENESNPLAAFKTEVSIGILAVVINLGFLKLSEIEKFEELLASMSADNLTLASAIGLMLMGISYLTYIFAILAGLWQAFHSRSIKIPLVVAVGSFFLVYVMLIFNAFGALTL